MLRNAGATLCVVVTRDLPMPTLGIYPFVARRVAMGQDEHIFILFHDSHPRPNWANPFATH